MYKMYKKEYFQYKRELQIKTTTYKRVKRNVALSKNIMVLKLRKNLGVY